MQKNLLQNADFSAIENGSPIGWRTWSPREALNPVFTVDSAVKRSGGRSLKISGGGNQYCFGRWFQRVPMIASLRSQQRLHIPSDLNSRCSANGISLIRNS
jgi:hypothetical protein